MTILVVLILPLPPVLLDLFLAISIILSVLILMTSLFIHTQVPALIVSTAAGLLVSKAGVGGGVDQALLRQLSGYPKALGMSAAVMSVMSLLPGIPMLPFLFLAGGSAAIAYLIDKRNKEQLAREATVAQE